MKFIDFRFPGLDTVRCVFTTRQESTDHGAFAGGNLSLEVGDDETAVRTNRENLRRELGFSVWQELRQVHQQGVYMELEDDFMNGATLEGDGMCTSRPGHALVTKTADCQAILMADREGRHVGALHCGWRGNAGNFPAAGVRKFCEYYGVDPVDVLVVRGPSLGPGKSEFVNFEKEWSPLFRSYYDPETRSVDLWTLTRNQLMGTGIPARNIFSIDICTFTSPQFFSYRRNTVTGRQAGIIWIE